MVGSWSECMGHNDKCLNKRFVFEESLNYSHLIMDCNFHSKVWTFFEDIWGAMVSVKVSLGKELSCWVFKGKKDTNECCDGNDPIQFAWDMRGRDNL